MNETAHTEKTKMLGNEVTAGRAKCFNLEPHERCGLCGLQVCVKDSLRLSPVTLFYCCRILYSKDCKVTCDRYLGT